MVHPRQLIVAVAGVAATVFFANVVGTVYPVRDWLFWTLLALWGWVGLLNLACLIFGHFVLRRVLGLRDLPPLEAAVFAMAIGVVVFVFCMYVGGALALFGTAFALLLPTALIAIGSSEAPALFSGLRREFTQPEPRSPLTAVIVALGVLGVGLAYLGVLTPDALNYDSVWYHAVIPQEYARQGRLIAFPGNYNMGVPHLHGMLHTWGFTVPGLSMPERWMLLLHNEFALFLWTLAGVLVGVRRLLDDQAIRGAWVGVFLFPSIFVYDQNMGGAADHVAAFFAVPMLVAMLHVCRTFSPGSAALFAITAAGCVLTKYQAVYLLAPMGAILVVAWARHARSARKGDQTPWRQLIRAPAVAFGVGCLLVAPHFLKNAIFYGNPLYPLGQELFTSSWPSTPQGPFLIKYIFTDDNHKPHGTLIERTLHALRLVVTFSFQPHYSFTKNFPNFGSLFTLLLPLIGIVQRPARLILAAVVGLGALFIWGFTYNVDRNLQLILPLLAAVTAGAIIGLWRLGRIARLGLIPLVGLQVVWGGDAFFYSAQDRINGAMALIRSGYDGNAKHRFDGYRGIYRSIGDALPQNARVLLHMTHGSLGIDREIVQDWPAFQGFIDFSSLHTPREVHDYLKARGVTHILYVPGERAASSKQHELLFQAYVNKYAQPVGTYGGFRLMKLADAPPPEEPPYQVGSLGLSGYADGRYPIERMNTIEDLPGHVRTFQGPDRPLAGADAELADADAVFIGSGARPSPELGALLQQRFMFLASYGGGFTLYVRTQR